MRLGLLRRPHLLSHRLRHVRRRCGMRDGGRRGSGSRGARALAQQQPSDDAGESQAGKQSGSKQQHNHKGPGIVRSVQRLSAKPVLTAMQVCDANGARHARLPGPDTGNDLLHCSDE